MLLYHIAFHFQECIRKGQILYRGAAEKLEMQPCVSVVRSLPPVLKLYSLQSIFMFALLISDLEGIKSPFG